MSYNPNSPNANQSPSLFPAENNTNLTRSQNVINAEHFFGNAPAANDGTHRQVTLTNRASPVVLPAGTNAIFYSLLNRPRFYDGTYNYNLPPLLASVTFTNTPNVVGVALNVAGVVRNATGDFTVTFTTPLPNINGQWSVHASSTVVNVGLVATIVDYNVNSMRIRVTNMTDNRTDPARCCLMVYLGY